MELNFQMENTFTTIEAGQCHAAIDQADSVERTLLHNS